MTLRQLLGKKLLLLDGGFGTQLQLKGLGAGELPELWNLTKPQEVLSIHESYLNAGSDLIMSNTFGANALKYPDNIEQVVFEGVRLAKAAAEKYSTPDKPRFAMLDLGPTGKLLKPMGDLDFEQCIALYAQVVKTAVKAGADGVAIETITDLYEAKAAVLAVKENSTLPVYLTITPDENGRLLTGGTIASAVAMLEGLRVDAIGLNCGLGPVQMLAFVQEMACISSLPIIVKPNAGLPVSCKGVTSYDISSDEFVEAMIKIINAGASAVGGCCGTTPKYIEKLFHVCQNKNLIAVNEKSFTIICGSSGVVNIGEVPVIIGERINPTGKKAFKQALLDNNIDYILSEGIKQQNSGAHILDVNVGMPEINETEMLARVVADLQGVTGLPLQIDTASAQALEKALRLYNGKPLINSVNGKKESMEAVFPLAAKYGGVVVGLTLDENGIPSTVEGRIEIAEKIINTAEKYGIKRKDIIIDTLTMTISAEPESAKITLEAVKQIKEQFNVNTVLGVSNISFGLPRRELISSTFFALALANGLTAAIINPCSSEMMSAYRSFLALYGYDSSSLNYIEAYAQTSANTQAADLSEINLSSAVEKGLREISQVQTKKLLKEGENPLDIIEKYLVPSLDTVGKGFELQKIFLPQLMLSAEAAKAAFAIISEAMLASGNKRSQRGVIVLATVKGDIHDIGKNIVKVLLENYSYKVIDLGKDVAPEAIVETVLKHNVKLVGLSALMTTTVCAMEETIKLLNCAAPDCKIMVGGAVLTQQYADSINADQYSSDAMASVRYANKIFLEKE